MANHNGTAFPILKCRGLWDDKIAKDATVVEMKKAKAIHKACSKDYKIWKTVEDDCKKLIGDVHQQTQGWYHVLPQGLCT